jgi:hypothetical protein
MTDEDGIACCNQCKPPLIKIDNYGELLTGCLTGNLFFGLTLGNRTSAYAWRPGERRDLPRACRRGPGTEPPPC